jgi:peptidoglycan/xylan/chitin deacetylase (PgdA/CDA1 family)
VKAILTYHSLDGTGSPISVHPRVFERQVRWLASAPVDVVALTELLDVPDDRDALAVTFDDAFTNFATEAWPRLREHGLPVTLFAPTGFVGHSNSWAAIPGGRMPGLPILDWPALGRLQNEGVVIGAHSRTHPDLRFLDEAALEVEVLGSLDDIESKTGKRPDTFAYPYGYWSAAAASVVRRACRFACTTELRPLGREDEAHLLPRLDAFYLFGPGKLEDFGRPTFRRYLQLRAQVRVVGQWARARLRS